MKSLTMRTHISRLLGTLITVLLTAPCWAENADPNTDIELPGADASALPGDGGVDLEDVTLVGNPLRRVLSNWPEDLVVAPVPGRSPQMGWELTLAGTYFIGKRSEDAPPPSMVGGFAMFSENGSYIYGGGANLHLLDDQLRVGVGAGYMDVRYRYYGIGQDVNETDLNVDVVMRAPLYFGSASWRVWNKLYIGLGYIGGDVESSLRFDLPVDPFPDVSLDLRIGGIELPFEYDARDHEQFPRNGWLIDGGVTLYRESVGSDFNADTTELTINRYLPVREHDVLALRAYMHATSGDAPFFLLSAFGGATDLRGYPSGRYRDRMMYALQGEYRWQVNDKWILTGFAGFGEVAEKFSDFASASDNLLPAVGIGARRVLSQKHRVSLSLDLASGKDGTEFYVGVGEAF